VILCSKAFDVALKHFQENNTLLFWCPMTFFDLKFCRRNWKVHTMQSSNSPRIHWIGKIHIHTHHMGGLVARISPVGRDQEHFNWTLTSLHG
jgi:hypothetical protein